MSEKIWVRSLQPLATYARIEVEVSLDIESNQHRHHPLSSSPEAQWIRLNSTLPSASTTTESLFDLYGSLPPPVPGERRVHVMSGVGLTTIFLAENLDPFSDDNS